MDKSVGIRLPLWVIVINNTNYHLFTVNVAATLTNSKNRALREESANVGATLAAITLVIKGSCMQRSKKRRIAFNGSFVHSLPSF